MSLRHFLGCLCILIFAVISQADTLKLKDGSTLDGKVIDQGTQYWVKDANGQSQLIDKDKVASWVRSATPSVAVPKSPAPEAHPASGGRSFAAVKAKADLVDTPIAAVSLWQSFIDSKPDPKDLDAAKVELKHWQQMLDDSAERVNGKWVGGDDRKKLIKHVRELIQQGDEALAGNQTLTAIAKFEEAVKIYPNNFEANFALGYFNLVQGTETGKNSAKIDAGIRSLETASKLRPDCAAALSDLSIGYNFRGRYELSVMTAYHAAKIEDSKEIVQNLVNSIAQAPPGMRQNNSKIKPIMQEAGLLAMKYGISDGQHEWAWVHPDDKESGGAKSGGGEKDEDESTGPPGIFANGSGFLITPDGYIVTNRHVAKPGDYLVVRLLDGTEKMAERVVIDDEQDLAVIKIKTNTDLPFVKLAPYDHPPTGANVYVFGFPLLGQFGLNSNVKMTRGGVSAWDKDQEYCDVTVDAQVNPGNSGGPMVDSHGNLLAITAMKTLAVDSAVSSYGLGLSTGRIRTFLDKQKARLVKAPTTPGKEDGPELSGEEIANRLTPATVCVFCCRGKPPADGQRVEKSETEAP